jgi:tripartite-type tricarboxylate transporter receptor subunit TctC
VPFIQAGRLRAIATSTAKRISALPDLPPVADAIPGFETITWQGFVVPTGTPKDVVDRLHKEFVRALKDPEFAARMRGMGLEIYGTTPAQFGEYIRNENIKWTKVIKATGARVD